MFLLGPILLVLLDYLSLCRSDPDEERGMEEMGEEERHRTKQATREAVRDFVVREIVGS